LRASRGRERFAFELRLGSDAHLAFCGTRGPPCPDGEDDDGSQLRPAAAQSRLGRDCAAAALGRLGVPGRTVERGAHGEPVWPEHIVGSISHTEGFACALAVNGLHAVGVDVERTDRELLPRTWAHVAAECPADARSQDRHAIFSVKEAFFKLAFKDVGRVFGFGAVRVTLFGAGRGCRVDVVEPLSERVPRGASCRGNYLFFDSFVLAWVCAPAPLRVAP
jgi:4'-phosphopantetheinyl transferase EntD